MDFFGAKLHGFQDIDYVHPLFEHSWGHRVVRFYDPDKHIIEVGEAIEPYLTFSVYADRSS